MKITETEKKNSISYFLLMRGAVLFIVWGEECTKGFVFFHTHGKISLERKRGEMIHIIDCCTTAKNKAGCSTFL